MFLTALATFAAEHAGVSRRDFLATFDCPFLFFPSPGRADWPPTFMTVVQRPEADASQTAPRGLIPVRKDPGRNVFAHMVTLGRAANNDLVLTDSRISKFHVYFQRQAGGRWCVVEAGSTNGTAVEGLPLVPGERIELEPGTALRLADAMDAFFLSAAQVYTDLVQGEL